VEVELGQQLVDLLRAAHEQGQDAALEPLLEPPHPRAAHGDRAAAHRDPPLLAVAVAVALGGIHGLAALGLTPTEELGDLLLEEVLEELLDLRAGEPLEVLPHDA
jgi:hypothetical protein